MRTFFLLIFLFTMVLSSCYDHHSASDGGEVEISANCTFAELRELCSDECRTITENAICVGRITSSDSEGNFYRTIVVEDASGAAEIKLGIFNSATQYPIGLEIAIKLQNTAIATKNGSIVIGLPPMSYDTSPREFESQAIIDNHIVRGYTITSISPTEHNICDLDLSMCGRYIKLSQLLYSPQEEDAPGRFEGYNRFTDKEEREVFLLVDSHAEFSTENIPFSTVDIEGILYYETISKEKGKQFTIKPRFRDDIATCDNNI